MTHQEILDTVVPILKKHGVFHASIFGSFARGEQRTDSDLDLRVDLPQGTTLFGLCRLENELESAVHLKVDVLDSGAKVHPIVLKNILKEEIPLF
jgi:predicted nucleotidyltransferase